MIKIIAIIDSLRGIIEEPVDDIKEIYDKKIASSMVLSASDSNMSLQEQLDHLKGLDSTTWLTGPPELLELALPYAKELFLIQVDGMFDCKHQFPHFEDTFYMEKRKPIQITNGLQFQRQLWRPDLTNLKDTWDFDIREDVE